MPGEVWGVTVAIILLAIAVSIDGWLAGLALGLRRLVLTPGAQFLVALFSGGMVWVAMAAGQGLTAVLSPPVAARIGALLFLVLGLWLLSSIARAPRAKPLPANASRRWWRRFAQVRSEASRADLDHSGKVQGWETMLLGAALGLDALGAGVAAALMGLPPAATVVAVAVAKLVMLGLGLRLGSQLGLAAPGWANLAAGLLFILLALMSWF